MVLLAGFIFGGEDNYAHISYVDGSVSVERTDGRVESGSVNLSLVPGDLLRTDENGRCEIQFENGTILRLNHGTRLLFRTVLAPSLATTWKITTLELQSGELYSINQNYRQEMFQVITNNAAVNLKTDSTCYIGFDEEKNTDVFCKRGKIQVMYGETADSLREKTIRGKESGRISSAHEFEPSSEADSEFLGWNEYVNNHFEEIHEGINILPAPIQRYPAGLVDHAMNWSYRYGKWTYHETLGLAWEPYTREWIHNRPFFFADFIEDGNRLLAVPQESWGWIPAYLGRWFWIGERGWTWIPGTNRSYANRSHCSGGLLNYNWTTFDIGFSWAENPWFHYYRPSYSVYSFYLDNIDVRFLVPLSTNNSWYFYLANKRYWDDDWLREMWRGDVYPSPSQGHHGGIPFEKTEETMKPKSIHVAGFRDWNPDRRILSARGIDYRYDSGNNEVIWPVTGISSRKISDAGKWSLRNGSDFGGKYRNSAESTSGSITSAVTETGAGASSSVSSLSDSGSTRSTSSDTGRSVKKD